MDVGRQVIRFSLPGGVFGLLGSIYLAVFSVAWFGVGGLESTSSSAPEGNIATLTEPFFDSSLATVAGLLISGFIIYQLYYYFYRPQLRRVPRPRDRGGEILAALLTIDGFPEWIATTFGISEIQVTSHKYERNKSAREHWYSNNHLVRSLLTYVADRGGQNIKSDFGYRSDMYHSLGACRWASFAALIAIVAFLLGAHNDMVLSAPIWSLAALLI